ncbi:MAG: AMP-binding protein [Sporichthyaceae bacterium]
MRNLIKLGADVGVGLAAASARTTLGAPATALRAAGFLAHNAADLLGGLRATAASGVVNPLRPDLTVRQLLALARDGAGLPAAVTIAAKLNPHGPAVLDESGTLSWSDLDGRSRRLAVGLADLGIGAGDRVGVLCRNHSGMVEALVATGRVGADTVLLNTGAGPAALERIATTQRLRLLLADADLPLPPTLPSDLQVRIAWHDGPAARDTLDQLIAGARPARRLRRPARPGRLILLTSGTTGTPKGAARPDVNLVGGMLAVIGLLGRIPLRAGAVTAIPAPLFHAWGLGGLTLAFALRCPVVLRRHFDATELSGLLTTERVEQLFVVPVMLNRMLALPDPTPAAQLRVIVSSGSALAPRTVAETQQRFGDVLHNLYGSTEVSWVSVAGPADLRHAPGTAGTPPLGTRLRILDPDGEELAAGEVGRIFVGNSMLFSGYLDGAGDPTTVAGLVAVGDLGHLDGTGRLHVDGREDDLVVSGGENVFCREVADVVADLSGVADVAVVGVPDAEFGQRLAAFLVLEPGCALTADHVRRAVRERLARHAVPREVVFLDELPRNAAGKVLSRELRDAT